MEIQEALIVTLNESELASWHSGIVSLQWMANRDGKVVLVANEAGDIVGSYYPEQGEG